MTMKLAIMKQVQVGRTLLRLRRRRLRGLVVGVFYHMDAFRTQTDPRIETGASSGFVGHRAWDRLGEDGSTGQAEEAEGWVG